MRDTQFGILLMAALVVTAACDDDVMGPPVASVEVTPDSSAVPVEGTVQLSATLRDAGDTVVTGRTVTWSSSDESLAIVDGNGLVTAVAAGPVVIIATSEEVVGTAKVTVLETFTATLLLANAVPLPLVPTNAAGSATVFIDGNLLSSKVDVTTIDDVVAAHIRSGAVRDIGLIIVDFGITGQAGNFTGNLVDDTMTVDDATLADIGSGNAYVNIPTVLNPDGEIRGQLFPLADETFTATLDGASEVPSVMTNATGMATHTVRRMLLSYRIDVADIDAVTRAHIHSGAVGVVGNIIVGLFEGPTTDLMFTGTLVDSTTTITDAVLLELRSGDTYTNVHTEMHVPGEIRGQNVPQ